jgi:formyltetrahydrofolate synthetase
MTSIIAYEIPNLVAINTDTSDATRMFESLGVVCLWATAGLALTAVFALGLGGEVGQFLANAG